MSASKTLIKVEKFDIFLFCCAFFLSLHIYANFARLVKQYGRKLLGIVESNRLIKILAIFLLSFVLKPTMVFAQGESAPSTPVYANETERLKAEREANLKRIREENARRSEAIKEKQREREEQQKLHKQEQQRIAAEKLEQQKLERELRAQREREKQAELKEKWAEKKRLENEARAAKLQREQERKAEIKEREAQKKAAEMEARQREHERRQEMEQKRRELKAKEAEKAAERRAKEAELRQKRLQKQQEERQRKMDKMAEQRERHRQRQEQEMAERQRKREEEIKRREELVIQRQKHAELKAKRDSVEAVRKSAEIERQKKMEQNMLEAKKQEEAIKEARKQAEKIYKNKSKIKKAQEKALAEAEDKKQKEIDKVAQDSADYVLAKAIAEGDSSALVGVSAKRLKKLPQVVAKTKANAELTEEVTLQEPEEEVDPTRATIEAVLQRRKKAAQKAVIEAARADSIAKAAAADTTSDPNANPYDTPGSSSSKEEDSNALVQVGDSITNEEFIEGEDSIDIDDLRAYALQDSSLLAQQLAELEEEMRNIEEIKAAEKAQKEGKSEEIVIKIKIPKCRYLNEVHYERGKYRFIYDYDFFLYYWHQRYFHKKKFYNINDSTRVVAKYLMDQVGNTKYRRVLFNTVIDSVSHLLPEEYGPIDTLVDSLMTELNLEYLSTGEIKVFYKNRRQRKIVAKLRPTGEYYQPIGNIKFYTSNRRKVIEELDGSPYDSLIASLQDTVDEDIEFLTDSLERLKLAIDASSLVLDSLGVESEREHEARKLKEKERQRQQLQERIERATQKKLEEERRREEEERLRREEEERLRMEESKKHKFPFFPTVTSNSNAEAAPTEIKPKIDEDDAEITDDDEDDSSSKKRKRKKRSRNLDDDDDAPVEGDDDE